MKKLNKSQIKTIVDILVNVGVIGFGTVAIPVALDKGNLVVIVLGVVTSLLIWYTAIVVSKLIR